MRRYKYCLCPLPWSAASSLYSPRQLNNQLNALQISNSFLLRSRSQRWVNIEKVETKKNRSSSQLYHYKQQKTLWMLIAIYFWLYCMDLSHHNECVVFSIVCFIFLPGPDRLQCVTWCYPRVHRSHAPCSEFASESGLESYSSVKYDSCLVSVSPSGSWIFPVCAVIVNSKSCPSCHLWIVYSRAWAWEQAKDDKEHWA